MSDAATMDAIFHGKYQLVFFTPEMIISKKHWRRLLGGDVYANRLKALIIDEAHCVKKWYHYVFDSSFFIPIILLQGWDFQANAVENWRSAQPHSNISSCDAANSNSYPKWHFIHFSYCWPKKPICHYESPSNPKFDVCCWIVQKYTRDIPKLGPEIGNREKQVSWSSWISPRGHVYKCHWSSP